MQTFPPRYALKARWVFPVVGRPLSDAIVRIENGSITSIGSTEADGCPVFDLGNVALLPGLVNAHTHLEFSNLPRPLGNAGITFPEWLDQVIQGLRNSSDSDRVVTRTAAVAAGLRESLRFGTTTVGNITSVHGRPTDAELLVHWDTPAGLGPECISFQELLGLQFSSSDMGWLAFRTALKFAKTDARDPDQIWTPAISPHSPYTVRTDLVEAASETSAINRYPLAMHLAESREELELLAYQRGPLVDVLRRFDAWDATLFTQGAKPLDYLKRLSVAYRAIIIHGNYLDDDELAYLAEHKARLTVVYCPRTHAYFGHEPYPLAAMLARGVSVAVGTDGRGSNPDLSLLAEMRHVAAHHPAVSPATVLKLGTFNGAKALGRSNRVGALKPGRDANLVVVPLPDRDDRDPHRLILDSAIPPRMTIFRGRVVFESEPTAEH